MRSKVVVRYYPGCCKIIKNYIKNKPKYNIYKTSTTGIASILINGITIHSYSGLETGKYSVNYYLNKIRKRTVIQTVLY